MDFKKNIGAIEAKIGYTFRDKSLLMQAFTRTSFCNEKNYGGRENFSSNEVLEFFGDSVLSTAIVTLLLRKNTKRYAHGISTSLTEGDFSNIRSKLSDKRNLSKCLASMGLQRFMLMGDGDAKLSINEEPSVMEDLFESIIGAIYIDTDMNIEKVISVVEGILDISAYADGEPVIQSYKNALQEWCADKKRRLSPPTYKTISESGPDHKKIYERGVYIGEKLWGIGKGKNQKLADTAAAEAALLALMENEKEEKRKKEAEGALGAAKLLREMATKMKQPSPEYHDLGEVLSPGAGGALFTVECRFMGKVERHEARTKQEARDGASAKMLSMITGGEKKTKPKNSGDNKKPEVKKQKNVADEKAKATAIDKKQIKKRKPKASAKRG